MKVGSIYKYKTERLPCLVVITKVIDNKNPEKRIAVGFSLSDSNDTRSIDEQNWKYWEEVN